MQLNAVQQPSYGTVHQLANPALYSDDLKKLFEDAGHFNLGTQAQPVGQPILPLQELYQLSNVVEPSQFAQFRPAQIQIPILPLQNLDAFFEKKNEFQHDENVVNTEDTVTHTETKPGVNKGAVAAGVVGAGLLAGLAIAAAAASKHHI